jgi:hypothetical protein
MLVSLKLAGTSAESYGGRILASAGSSSVTTTLANLEILTWLGGVVIPLLVAGAVIEAARQRRLTPPLRYWLLGASLGVLLVVPQLAVYRGESNFGVGRYILPAGLGMVASIAAGNAWLRRQKYVALYVSVATILAVSMPIFAVWTLQEAQQYRADSFVLAQAVGAITASARSGTTVGIAADPLVTYEYAVAFPYQLTWRGRADLDRRLLIAYDPQADSAEARAVGENLASHFPGHADLAERGCTNVDAVVLLAPEDRVMHLMPCLASSDFRLATFSETVAVSNFLPSPYRMFFPPRTVGYLILMRHSP